MSDGPRPPLDDSRGIAIRRAEPEEIDELVSIDDDASLLYASAGLPLTLSNLHPFVLDERARWLRAAQRGRVLLASEGAEQYLGMAVLDIVDEHPYLDQLAVRMASMRRGIGSLLLRHALEWAQQRGARLWLTTYDHLAWNRPFYERAGFVGVPEDQCGEGVLHHLQEQRRWLPEPTHRVAMRRSFAAA